MIKLFVVEIDRSQLYEKFNGKTESKNEVNTEIKKITENSNNPINLQPIVELLYSMMIFNEKDN